MNDEHAVRLVDRTSITDVLVEYCCALDRMDLERLSQLFTEDCAVEYGPDPRLQTRGRAALAKSLERLWRWSRTSHHLSNVQIRFDDKSSATVGSYVHAWHERADGSTATVLGQYHDRFVHVDGAWLIAERRMVMNGSDAGFTVDIHRFERIPQPAGWVAPDIDKPTASE